MVAKGQFLERPTLIPRGQVALEALSHRGSRTPPVLFVPPPPERGNMDHVVLNEVVWAVATAGHATLRFNFRGAGASPGPAGDESSRLEEAACALEQLEQNTACTRVAVVALDESATLACELARHHSSVAGVCWISPHAFAVESLLRLRKLEGLVVVAQEDRQLPRSALSAVVDEAGMMLEVIPKADASFTRNLSEVGKAVVGWLSRWGDRLG
jgi:hypothetical protein